MDLQARVVTAVPEILRRCADRLVELIKEHYDKNWERQEERYKSPPRGPKRGYLTGMLFNTITREEPEGDEIIVRTGVPYAKFHEFGTIRLPAVGYMNRELPLSQQELREIVATEISKLAR